MNPKAILFDLDDTILQCMGGDYMKLWMASVAEHIHMFPNITTQELFTEIRRVADVF